VITSPAFAGKTYGVYGLARSGKATVAALLASREFEQVRTRPDKHARLLRQLVDILGPAAAPGLRIFL
jgi:hypothetical protein